MGLSASQARLLTLTSRLHDIEYQQQQLANTKLRFSIESDEVSSKYSQELSKQKLQFKNDSGNYVDMTLRTLLESGQYSLIRTSDGKKIVAGDIGSGSSSGLSISGSAGSAAARQNTLTDEQIRARYSTNIPQSAIQALRNNSAISEFLNPLSAFNKSGSVSITPLWDNQNRQIVVPNGATGNKSIEGFGYISEDDYQRILSVLGASGNDATKRTSQTPQYEMAVIDNKYLNDANWLYEAIESGEFRLVDAAGSQVNPTSTTGIDTISDRSNEAKAKADYDAAMNKINKKEKAIDVQMRQLETEYQATNQDLTSVKSLVEKHTKDDFSLFG